MRVALAALALILGGCSASTPELAKEDFSKRSPPPGWHGPEATPMGAKPPAGVGGG